MQIILCMLFRSFHFIEKYYNALILIHDLHLSLLQKAEVSDGYSFTLQNWQKWNGYDVSCVTIKL